MGLNTSSRTINVSKNAFTAILGKVVLLFLTFISRKIFIKYIGIDYLGISALFANVLTLLSMADFGLGTAMNVSLYKPIANNDIKKLSALLHYFKVLYYIIATVVFLFGVSLIPFLKYIINFNNHIDGIYLFYLLFVLNTVASYLFVYKTSIINADQKNYILNVVDIFLNVIKIAIQVFFAIVIKNYTVFLIIEVLSTSFRNIIVSIIADRLYPFIKEKNFLSKEEKKLFNEDFFSAFLYRIGGSFLGGTDNILISVIVGTTAVGLYYNYFTITSTLETMIYLFFGSFTASVGNLLASSNRSKTYITFTTMQMIGNWLSAVISICLFFLCQDFINIIWLKDSSLLLDNIVIIAISINMFYTICMRPVWTYREGTGMYRQIRYIMLITAIINIFLSIMLGKKYGIGGILIATTIAKFVSCFWYEPYILFKKFFGIQPHRYYISYFLNLIITGICFVVCYFVMKLFPVYGIFSWIVKGIVILVLITIIYLIRYFNTNEFKNLVSKVNNYINK